MYPSVVYGQVKQSDDPDLKEETYVVSLLRSSTELVLNSKSTEQDEAQIEVTGNLTMEVKQHEMKQLNEIMANMEAAVLVYQTLYQQLGVNKEKIQSVLVLDGGLQESRIALSLLQKLGIRILACTVDTFELQKQLISE